MDEFKIEVILEELNNENELEAFAIELQNENPKMKIRAEGNNLVIA